MLCFQPKKWRRFPDIRSAILGTFAQPTRATKRCLKSGMFFHGETVLSAAFKDSRLLSRVLSMRGSLAPEDPWHHT